MLADAPDPRDARLMLKHQTVGPRHLGQFSNRSLASQLISVSPNRCTRHTRIKKTDPRTVFRFFSNRFLTCTYMLETSIVLVVKKDDRVVKVVSGDAPYSGEV